MYPPQNQNKLDVWDAETSRDPLHSVKAHTRTVRLVEEIHYKHCLDKLLLMSPCLVILTGPILIPTALHHVQWTHLSIPGM